MLRTVDIFAQIIGGQTRELYARQDALNCLLESRPNTTGERHKNLIRLFDTLFSLDEHFVRCVTDASRKLSLVDVDLGFVWFDFESRHLVLDVYPRYDKDEGQHCNIDTFLSPKDQAWRKKQYSVATMFLALKWPSPEEWRALPMLVPAKLVLPSSDEGVTNLGGALTFPRRLRDQLLTLA